MNTIDAKLASASIPALRRHAAGWPDRAQALAALRASVTGDARPLPTAFTCHRST
ncbi:MAG: hypothetical protein WCJ31_10095 [Planctomycetia bacterium]